MTSCEHPELICSKCGEMIADVVPQDVVANLERERRKERDRAQAKMRQATQLLENAPATDDILTVVTGWEERFAPNFRAHRRASSPGSKAVRRAFGWGFTVDELLLAFDGAIRDDWTMGRTEKSAGKRNRFTALTYLLADPDRLRGFMDLALKPLELVAPELVDTSSVLAQRTRDAQDKLRKLRALREDDRAFLAELVQQLKAANLIVEVQARAIGLLSDEWQRGLEAEWMAVRDERVRVAEASVRDLLPLALAAERAGLAPVDEVLEAA